MRKAIQFMIRFRNPNFQFDPELKLSTLLSFTVTQGISVLRGFTLLRYFKKPKMAILGKRVTFFNAVDIHFGRFMRLGNDVHISALGKQGVTLGDHVGIGAYSRIMVSTTLHQLGEYIRIGNNVGIGEYAYLGGAGGLEIGEECIIGQYFSCHPENHHYSDLSRSIRHQGVDRKGIRIGRNCWIGSKVTILDGVTIGEGSVIAAGAVVNKSFPPHSILGGVPAKLIKSRA